MPRLTKAQKEMYQEFVDEFPFCMNCGFEIVDGRSIYQFGVPSWLENAHIVGGPGRKADRRAIVRLCKMCHGCQHGARFKMINGLYVPKVTQGNLVWMKARFDSKYLEIDFLNDCSIGICDEMEKPDEFFTKLFGTRQRKRHDAFPVPDHQC